MAMYKNLLSEISTYFSISGEMIPQNGEDSYLYSFNENKALVGVLTGAEESVLDDMKYLTVKQAHILLQE